MSPIKFFANLGNSEHLSSISNHEHRNAGCIFVTSAFSHSKTFFRYQIFRHSKRMAKCRGTSIDPYCHISSHLPEGRLVHGQGKCMFSPPVRAAPATAASHILVLHIIPLYITLPLPHRLPFCCRIVLLQYRIDRCISSVATISSSATIASPPLPDDLPGQRVLSFQCCIITRSPTVSTATLAPPSRHLCSRASPMSYPHLV